ncbi:MAG: hypothetical protein AAFY41_14765 [Bacteroidota bacterium]
MHHNQHFLNSSVKTSSGVSVSKSRFQFVLSAFVATTMGFTVALPTQAQSVFDQIEVEETKQSVVSRWISDALEAVTTPEGAPLGPTGASRAYGILGTVMYDAWTAFDVATSTLEADGYIPAGSLDTSVPTTQANKEEAISYAAFGVLSDLFP